jgi:putative membrane protein
MNDAIENRKTPTSNDNNVVDHLANERTFLAWIRTSIGVMAFGFVVEKFAYFIEKIAFYIGKDNSQMNSSHSAEVQGYSSIFGVCLVGLGVLICLLAFFKYKQVEKQIDNNTYQASLLLDVMLLLSVLLIGIFLAILLENSF